MLSAVIVSKSAAINSKFELYSSVLVNLFLSQGVPVSAKQSQTTRLYHIADLLRMPMVS